MPSQAERREKTRAKLIQSARSFFANHGFDDTHTGDILEEAGVSRGAMYHHFATKKDMFEAVFVHESEATITLANKGLKPSDSPLEDLIQSCLRWLKVVQDPTSAAILLDQGPKVLGWQKARDLESESSLDLMRRGLERAFKAKEIEIQSLELTARILNAIVAEAALAHLYGEPKTSKQTQEATIRLFIEGLKR